MRKIASQKRQDEVEKPQKGISSQKEKGWIKFVRFLVYAVSIVGVTVGASLIKVGGLSAAYADGTYAAKIENGEIIFFVSLVILYANIMWGILRWFLRGYREKWKPGRIIGKLIGGGIWRMLVIMPLMLLSFMVISSKVADAISDIVIEEQHNQKRISLSEPLNNLKYISEHLEDYTFEELEEELAPYFFKNIDFGVDASSNISKQQSPGLLTQNASAYASSVTVLNKAKLSSKGHFVVFYTDTGDDAISDKKAEELAEMLEEIIVGYEENLGLEYKYEKFTNYNTDVTTAIKIKSVLVASGVEKNDSDFFGASVLETAMPVYVANPYKEGSNILATYAGRRFAEYGNSILIRLGSIFGEETARLYDSAPSYPFVHILPENVDSESLAIVTAHELGHHYVATYSYDNYGGIGNDDDFIDETTPNWMAINVLLNQPPGNLINDNHYQYSYLNDATSVKISGVAPGFLGYPAVAFLENYYEVVPDAKTIIMDATYYGDALNYLYNHAGEDNFRKVMINLAEKNLTGEYGGKLMNYRETRRGKQYTLPKSEELQCTDLCTKEYSINPAATEYLYFAVDEYRGSKLSYDGGDGVSVSVLGRDTNNEWHILQSGKDNGEFIFADDMAEMYNLVAFAVANSNIEYSKKYEIGITSAEFEKLIDVAGKFDFDGLYQDLGQGCFEVNLDSLFDLYGKFMDLGGAVIDVIAAIDDTTDYSDLQNEWTKETNEVKDGVEEARQNAAKYRISVCANYIAEGRKFDEVKNTLQKAMGWNMNLYDERDGSDRMSVFFGFDLLTRQGKIYVLAESEGEMGLITINVSEN
ncbi:hypothetical protein IIY68_03015 [Candidatus Saccharibacteria bacterium]|nr:hypothetical protein [Candidatus Saccharibacteria bacterium]